MIKTQTNKNLIFIFSILNYYKNRSPYHKLGQKLLKKLNYEELDSFKKLTNQITNSKPQLHPYKYALLAIHTNEDLSPKKQDPKSGFGPNTCKMYTEEFEQPLKDIYKQSNFKSIYNSEILKDYEKLTIELSKYFNEDIYKNLLDFWNSNDDLNLILIPNILNVGHSFGLSRKNNIYSITSPNINNKTTDYIPQHMISNAIHEFSHSIFQKSINNRNLYKKHQELCNQFKLPKELDFKYPNKPIYLEETLIKTSTLVIKENIFITMPQDEIIKKRKEELSRIEKQGYPLATNLFSTIKNSEDVIGDYLSFLEQPTHYQDPVQPLAPVLTH